MEKYPILHICRTARFKIDSYIPKPETFFQLSGEMRLCIITTYFIWETSRVFYCIVSLQSLIETNDFRMWTPRTRWISRTCWTPDCSLSRKVRLLKIIKTDSIMSLEHILKYFLWPTQKKRHFLPPKDRYISVRCVILKDKARCLKILLKTLLEFVFLG